MGHFWRQAPALLAGAGVLTATLYVVALPARTHGEALPPQRGGQARPEGQATRPSEALARAVERVARGALPEPYFANQAAAAGFLDRWQGQLIDGRVRVAMADQFDAGAEHGHRVPVTVWIDSDSQVMGLTGEAVFEPGPGGLKLRDLRLEPVKLAVSGWAEAARRVQEAHPLDGQPTRTDAPFYGQFRFNQAGRRYAVDARTGEVVQE